MSKIIPIALLIASLAFASEYSCVALQGPPESPVDSGFCWIVLLDERDGNKYIASLDKGSGMIDPKPEITIVENIRFRDVAEQCDIAGCLYKSNKTAAEICPPIEGMSVSFEASDVLMTIKTPEEYERWRSNIISGMQSRLEYPSIRQDRNSVMRFASPYHDNRETLNVLSNHSTCNQYSHLPNTCEFTAAVPNELRYAKCNYMMK